VSERFFVEATGVCMWPAVREGDLLLCEPLGGSVPSKGEVLVAREDRGFVAHRFLRVRRYRGKEQLFLGADLGRPDRPRGRDEILGRVLLVYRQQEGLTDVAAVPAGDEDVGPVAAAILRRLARWHTRVTQLRNALRNHGDLPLQLSDVVATGSPDTSHLAREGAPRHGGAGHAGFP
jgi:hypothetical protein